MEGGTRVAPGQAGQPGTRHAPPRISVVIPCLNEAESIEECIRRAQAGIAAAGVDGEVIVSDNGSTDGSPGLAEAAGARVIHEPRRGYGAALRAGFAAAEGDYVLMADADLTYDFAEIPRFIEQLDAGADMVMGNRMAGIQPGAMPWLHQYVGNPLLSGLLNLMFHAGVRDAHCGMRAFRRDRLPLLDLRTDGMELASEMVIRAAKTCMDIREFDIEYHPREGESKLSSFRDGWRHLRFLLVHSPTHLFIVPGAALVGAGVIAMLVVLLRIDLLGREWDVHAMIAGSIMTVVGVQIAALGLIAHTYGSYYLGSREAWFDRWRARLRLEHGLAIGAAITAVGLGAAFVIVIQWFDRGFGALSEERLAILAATLTVAGLQVFFTSFVLSILGLRRPRNGSPQ